jgi:hypothetical protein
MGVYERIRQASLDDPETFWLDAAGALDWSVRPARALDGSAAPFYRWFPDGELNVCANALDRHVEAGRGEQAAPTANCGTRWRASPGCCATSAWAGATGSWCTCR